MAKASPEIHISPLDGGDWQVEYRLGYPVESLHFMRSAGFLREENWRVQTPGYSFTRNDEAQALVLDEGAEPVETVVIAFPVDTRFIVRDYELFNQFADGSLALFTGHFYVRPGGEKVPDERRQRFLTQLTITPPKGKRIGLQGELKAGTVSWTDATGEGTYAYIGNTPAVETDSVTAIFDRGLPAWIDQQARQRIPELLTLYTQRMGPHSARKPLVLFSYEPDSTQGYGSNGGTRDDLIQMRVSGAGWQQESAEPMAALIHLFAHEAAHLWNGQAVRSAPNTPPWIGEGSAEALAERALVDLTLITESAFWQYQAIALNACILGLKENNSLLTTSQNRLYYACGNVLSLWAERALQSAAPDKDLFDIWQHLINTAEAGTYSQSSYFKALAEMGVAPQHIEAMQAFVGSAHKNPAAVLADALAPFGLTLVRNDKAAPASAVMQASGQVLIALLKDDCSNGYGFYSHAHHIELSGLRGCQTAVEGAHITQIENTAITAPGFAAYQQAVAACAKKGKVKIGNDQKTMAIPCKAALPALEGWWQINSQ